MLKFLPEDYRPYLAYLPDLQACVNLFMTFTPLFSYGSTCYSIYKRQTSMGFSLDICCTMFMASILRIYYYFCSPYEPTLLRQSIIMILIQILLLKVSLYYRPANYDPELLTSMPLLENELNMRVPRRLSSATLEHQLYWLGDWISSLGTITFDIIKYVSGYFIAYFNQGLRFFDVYYRRPLSFWQWKLEANYWWFVIGFSTVFGITTLIFHENVMYSNIIGVLGLFIESLLPLPQILLLNRLQLVKNFKVILLLSWLGGDCTKISYLLFGTDNILIIFIVAGLFQMSLDIYIAFQYLQFKYFTTTNKNLNDGASLHRRNQLIDDVVNDLVSVSSEIELDVLEKGQKDISNNQTSSWSRSRSSTLA